MSCPPPVCLADLEDYACATLPRNALDYYRSGANEQFTLRDNLNAYKRYRIRPRFLTDVSKRNLKTTILGHTINFPVCIAPSAMQKMAHPDGELANAKAAGHHGVVFTLSTIATTSIEEIGEGAPDTLRFFQLYIYNDRSVTYNLVKRAEKAGFRALVLTVDTPFFGKRLADNRNRFRLPPHLKMANFATMEIKDKGLGGNEKASGVNKSRKESGLNEYANSLFDPSLTWQDVEWLKSITDLPIVLKGILTADDALLAVKHGASGIIVSNHGARQLDTVPATIDVLPEVVKAVKGQCEIYIDGGVRTGTDVLKALALGARAVFVGRPAIYGLAYNGEEGVKLMLQILKDEFSSALALSGCAKIEDIRQGLVVHETYYHSRL